MRNEVPYDDEAEFWDPNDLDVVMNGEQSTKEEEKNGVSEGKATESPEQEEVVKAK